MLRDLQKMAFKCFTKKFSIMRDMPAPDSSSISSKEDRWAQKKIYSKLAQSWQHYPLGKPAFHLNYCKDSLQMVEDVGTGKLTALSCLRQKVGWSSHESLLHRSLWDVLGLCQPEEGCCLLTYPERPWRTLG